MMFIPPLVSFDSITLDECNRCLVAWNHKMGPLRRPTGGGWTHGLMLHGETIGVAAADILIKSRCGGFTRREAIELARMCSVRKDLNRVLLRLWREFVFPHLGYRWVISYQDAAAHTGDLYRFDGWVRLGRSRSGSDPRGGGRQGRDKVIWGWCADPAERASVATARALEIAA